MDADTFDRIVQDYGRNGDADPLKTFRDKYEKSKGDEIDALGNLKVATRMSKLSFESVEERKKILPKLKKASKGLTTLQALSNVLDKNPNAVVIKDGKHDKKPISAIVKDLRRTLAEIADLTLGTKHDSLEYSCMMATASTEADIFASRITMGADVKSMLKTFGATNDAVMELEDLYSSDGQLWGSTKSLWSEECDQYWRAFAAIRADEGFPPEYLDADADDFGEQILAEFFPDDLLLWTALDDMEGEEKWTLSRYINTVDMCVDIITRSLSKRK